MIHQHSSYMNIQRWDPPSKPFQLDWEVEAADEDRHSDTVMEEFTSQTVLLARVAELLARDCLLCRPDDAS